MKIFTLILLAAFTITACAQKSPVEKFIKKQAKTEGISIKEIEPGSEDFNSQFQFEGEQIENALDQLDIIKVLSCDSASTTASIRDDFYSKAQDALQQEDYTELIRVHSDDNEDVSFYTNQMDNGLIREAVLLVAESHDIMMVYIKGEINLSNFFSKELLTSMQKVKSGKECR
ncbi:MAG: DUF4252 domain-containing protein [Bacteroidales bacterium]|nr:DUF4252 domain-containing protein [Bacteroidales bacterium]